MYILKDNLILNVSSFLIILYLFVPGIIQSFKDLEECERLRQNKIIKDGWSNYFIKLSFRILLISTCLFIAGLNASLKWLWITIGFVLFRIFDIIKPWPIARLDREVEGGQGIMLDDVIAGVIANILLRVIVQFL